MTGSVKPGDSVFVHATVARYDDHTFPLVEVEIEHESGKIVRTLHRDDLFWPPRPDVSPWLCLYGPVRALINRVNAALFDNRLDDAMREVSPMHIRATLITDAQALLAEDVARARAIRAVVAAQWAAMCAVRDEIEFRQNRQRLAQTAGKQSERETALMVVATDVAQQMGWASGSLPTAVQIVDGAA